MKTIIKITFLIFCFILTTNSYSQDTIRFKDKYVLGKVLEIMPQEIHYKEFNNLDGPLFIVNKSDVVSITYSNKQTELFGEPSIQHENQPAASNKAISREEIQTWINRKNLADVYIIKLTNGESVKGKIVEVSPQKLVYRDSSFLNGPNYYFYTREISSITTVWK